MLLLLSRESFGNALDGGCSQGKLGMVLSGVLPSFLDPHHVKKDTQGGSAGSFQHSV